jgi:hypothetical protein
MQYGELTCENPGMALLLRVYIFIRATAL